MNTKLTRIAAATALAGTLGVGAATVTASGAGAATRAEVIISCILDPDSDLVVSGGTLYCVIDDMWVLAV